MHIKKIDSIPQINDFPKGYKLIALGEFCGHEKDLFFAFIVPENVPTEPGTKIPDVKHAEGYDDDELEILDTKVDAFRKEDGGYKFTVKIGGRGTTNFIINPPDETESFHEDSLVKIHRFRRL
ncbi:MAG: hypothetical protein UY41_C0022G0009 [Candidatus Moranbacteria bacterium GW2011_GWE1_49_15]|nr:MAG: hypothetical protein UX75_C0041G0003 [Candidatus Moranbacteria bacterium GW2011_GWE2_47_10]KKW06530.1 MAG: hypothetical protein UY41_C0022G0009 [Candidatus Moranbacteria bacterium GW2011_GWE1_49_15]HBP01022.1 hypothetical protein [Candidatus Moranbacteria bacterium]